MKLQSCSPLADLCCTFPYRSTAPKFNLSNSKHPFAWCGIPSARNPFQLTTSQSSQSCFPHHREILHQVQPHKYQSSHLQLQSLTQSEDYPHSCSLCTSTWSIKDPSRHLLKSLRPWPWASININLSLQITEPMTTGQHQHHSSCWTIACWLESQSFKIALPQHRKLSTYRVPNSRSIYSQSMLSPCLYNVIAHADSIIQIADIQGTSETQASPELCINLRLNYTSTNFWYSGQISPNVALHIPVSSKVVE